jgi:hypothetical protein
LISVEFVPRAGDDFTAIEWLSAKGGASTGGQKMAKLIGNAGVVLAFGLAAASLLTSTASALTPQQCYKRDSNCTQFCKDAKADMRNECFNRCDIYLDNCLGTGDWTDQSKAVLSPDSENGGPVNPRSPIGKVAPLLEVQ